jgi:polyphosphate kinase
MPTRERVKRATAVEDVEALAAPTPDLNSPEFYLNRELSQLDFNARVLAQAEDPRVPLLERLRYLTICSTNLDEFFEVRVAGLKEQITYGVTTVGADGRTPAEIMAVVSERAHALVERQYEVLNDLLLPQLARPIAHGLQRHQY